MSGTLIRKHIPNIPFSFLGLCESAALLSPHSCVIFELSSGQYQKPGMITDDLIPDVMSWASEHKFQYPCSADATLVSLIELGFQITAYRQLRRVAFREPFHQAALLEDILRQQTAWSHRWISGSRGFTSDVSNHVCVDKCLYTAPPLELSRSQRGVLKFRNATGEFLCGEAKYDSLVEAPATSSIASHVVVDSLGVAVTKALDLLRVISDIFIPNQWMRLAQDTIMFDTARAGLFLAKVCIC
jgi:hypothetical protein